MDDLDRTAVLDALDAAYQNLTACRAARACGHPAVTAQGHVLTVAGFAAAAAGDGVAGRDHGSSPAGWTSADRAWNSGSNGRQRKLLRPSHPPGPGSEAGPPSRSRPGGRREVHLMDSQETQLLPLAAPARGDGTQLPAALWDGDRELRSAQLALALSGSRLRTDKTRAQYVSVIRKLTATGQDTAAVAIRLAERWPHRAERLLALSAAAEEAARESRLVAERADRGGVALGDPPAAAPARTAAAPARTPADTAEAIRLRSTALAQRLEQAIADVRATSAQIQQGRPRHEVLRHSAFARMRARLDSLPVIEQAKGVIMAQSRYSQDEAFDVLRRTSQRLNVPVRELAARIVAKAAASPGTGGKRRTQPTAANR